MFKKHYKFLQTNWEKIEGWEKTLYVNPGHRTSNIKLDQLVSSN